MNKVNLIRVSGLLVAFSSAVVFCMNGQYTEAVGVVGAALSAAGLKSDSQ